MPTESAPSRLLRRLGVVQWVAVFTGVLAGTALLVPWSNLVVMIAVGVVAVGALIAAVVLGRRVVALGGRSLFARKGDVADSSRQERGSS